MQTRERGRERDREKEREKGVKKKKKTTEGKERARINEILHCVTDVSGVQREGQ